MPETMQVEIPDVGGVVRVGEHLSDLFGQGSNTVEARQAKEKLKAFIVQMSELEKIKVGSIRFKNRIISRKSQLIYGLTIDTDRYYFAIHEDIFVFLDVQPVTRLTGESEKFYVAAAESLFAEWKRLLGV